MSQGEAPGSRRRLAVDLAELELAFDDGFWEHRHDLDLETGEVILVTDETSQLTEDFGEAEDELETDLTEEPSPPVPEWQREMGQQAARVQASLGTRYVEVPRAEPRDGYRDMEAFIETVQEASLQERLAGASGVAVGLAAGYCRGLMGGLCCSARPATGRG